MPEPKTLCKKCGAEIQIATSKRNGGLCGPCMQIHLECEACGLIPRSRSSMKAKTMKLAIGRGFLPISILKSEQVGAIQDAIRMGIGLPAIVRGKDEKEQRQKELVKKFQEKMLRMDDDCDLSVCERCDTTIQQAIQHGMVGNCSIAVQCGAQAQIPGQNAGRRRWWQFWK